MPRNASGTYSLPSGNPVVSGTLIEANWANTTLNDIANELTDSLSRSGEGGMLAPFRLADGLQASPGIAWLNEPSTGFYREGSGEMWGVVGGTQVLQYTAAGVLVPNGRTLTANGGISATTLSTSGAATLASASVTGNLSVGGTLTLTGGLTLNGNVTVGDASTDTLTINSTITSNLIFTDNTYDIGASGATRPRHLYLAGNGVIGGTLGVSGVLTASGGVTGNLTGNVTGNVTGNISGGTVAGTTGAFSSNVTVGGTLGVTGAATLSNTLAVTGAITATGGVLGNVTGDLTGNVTGNISGGTVAGSTGAFSSNVTVGGTLGVTGGSTLNGGVVINELGADADTRIEGDTDANLFFVDASTDRIGVGTDTPGAKFDIVDGANNSTGQLRLTNSGSFGTRMGFVSTSTNGRTYQIGSNFAVGAGEFSIYDATASAERLQISASGNLGLGVTPSAWDSGYRALQVGSRAVLTQGSNDTYVGNNWINDGTNKYIGTAAASIYGQVGGAHQWFTAASGNAGDPITFTQAMTLTAGGLLQVSGGSTNTTYTSSGEIALKNSGSSPNISWHSDTGTRIGYLQMQSSGIATLSVGVNQPLVFETNATERCRVTAAGELCVATSTPIFNSSNRGNITIGGSASSLLVLGTGTTTSTYIYHDQSNSNVEFWNSANGAIIFGTNNASRARITAGGELLVGTTNTNPVGADINGIAIVPGGRTAISRLGGEVLGINRGTDDGTLMSFAQAGNTEGSISVSGSTVSYNGGHLARWSQFPDGSHPELTKGTVMSNLDQMAVWEKDGQPLPNEQLNCMKVSDVEGDVNVAGVFVNWDNDDDVFANDMNVAMTGDMIIRIAQGVTVQRGDLLMSAGDGTAKPQGDDIIRSKTIAKVTSTHVTCTYEDGSYCVPCVLMAC